MARHQRTVILPDVHSPFENKPLMKRVCQFLHDERPDQLILPGDFLDLFTLSKYSAGSYKQIFDSGLTTEKEYELGAKLIRQIEDAVGKKCKKKFLYGNHCHRFHSWMETGDNGKLGKKTVMSPEVGLGIADTWEIKTNWQQDYFLLGKHFEVLHGVYLCTHAAKKHLDELQGSCAFGHSHKIQTYVSGVRAAYNIGWLGDAESKGFFYAPRSTRQRWTNGFAQVRVDDNGDFRCEVIQCYRDSFYANGKFYG